MRSSSTAAVVAVCALTLTAGYDAQRVAERPQPTVAPVPGGPASNYGLFTHCGIHELDYSGRWYVRVGGRLDDGSGNPPSGWNNPIQAGRLTVRGRTVVFTDDQGHRETFVQRSEGAPTDPPCS